MIVMDDGEVTSITSGNDEEIPLLDGDSNFDRGVDADRGDALITRRALSVQPKEDEENVQREGIFHTHCIVKNKVRSLIIDSGNYTNVASTLFVENLGLETVKHPKPYKLHWFAESRDMKVTK